MPGLRAVTDRVHDYRMQTIKDVPLARNTLLHLRKRRYRCSCGKRFFEQNTFLPRYYRVTSRLVAQIIHAFEKLVSAKEIGCRYNVSGVTAMRYFRCVNYKPKELPEVISLDEFKGNSGGQKYNSIVGDPKNHKIFDILPDRYESNLVKDFSQFESKFEIAPRLADAYRLKNEFLTVIHSGSSAVGRQRLKEWLLSVEVMDLPEFNDCTKAYRNGCALDKWLYRGL